MRRYECPALHEVNSLLRGRDIDHHHHNALKVCLLGLIVIGFSSFSQAFAEQTTTEGTEEEYLKMELSLWDLYLLYSEGDPSLVDYFTVTRGIWMVDESVRVVIELVEIDSKLPEGLGIVEEARDRNLVQAMVPIGNLKELSLNDNVKFITVARQPLSVVADSNSNGVGVGVGQEEIGEEFGTEADTDDIDTWLIAGIVASAAVGVGMFYYSKRRKQYVKKPL
jgi:hypothetical protein